MGRTEDTIEYLDPVSENRETNLIVPAVGPLEGRTIGFLSNGWRSYDAMGERIEQVFKARFRIAAMRRYSIPTSCAPAEGLLDRVASECDAAVVGMAN